MGGGAGCRDNFCGGMFREIVAVEPRGLQLTKYFQIANHRVITNVVTNVPINKLGTRDQV